jgi:hypothetical protein
MVGFIELDFVVCAFELEQINKVVAKIRTARFFIFKTFYQK